MNLNLPQILFANRDDKRAMTAASLFSDKNRYDISAGDRIAQLIIEKCYHTTWKEQEVLTDHKRNGGFGSTGI